jgi:two-component system response regulator AtoC
MPPMSRATGDSTSRLGPDLGGFELLVVGDGGSARIPLPSEGELVIGRGPEADVRLDGDSVSRRHALLRARQNGFTLEDLGSSNGTLVRGQPAPAHEEFAVMPGESMLVGDFVLILRALRARATTRHVWSHEYFEARVAEQCERGRESGGTPFCLLGVRVEPGAPLDASEIIAAELTASDVLGRLGPHEWCALLVDDSESDATALAARVDRALGAAGFRAQTTLIVFPRDGTSASALMRRVSEPPTLETESPVGADVVLRSQAMVDLYRQTDPIARGEINVLVLGETGVGKDVLAKSIHDRSARADKPFLRLNCAALSEPLLESELFGHEKGAFTGAVQNKRGLLQSAAGGTVFLDEIGEFPARLQPKLLQVIETKEIRSVGGITPQAIDVRFIAATNRDLEAEALSGHFRSDLFYRIAGFTAVIPPLRERREDILPLAQAFVRRLSAKMGVKGPVRIRDDAAVRLLDYAWPGNVRELRNVVERALVLSEGRGIGPEHLPLEKMRSVVLVSRRELTRSTDRDTEIPVADLTQEELFERQRIIDALANSAGNQSKAAELLGVSRSTLLNRLDAYRIRRPRKRPR